MSIKFNNTCLNLPANFYVHVRPTIVKSPKLVKFNFVLAKELGIPFECFNTQDLADVFSGNKILPGSASISFVYAGHQFGHFVSRLGDGRASLLGEIVDLQGLQRDIQLKGSGPTPFSRGGDGRATLGSVMREYIFSEAMQAMGISTTRALAIVTTGESALREVALPGAILTRAAKSHIRVGTFQYFSALRDLQSVKILADYTIERHFPEAKMATCPYRSLLRAIIERQASLIVDWMRVGFVHGVMNTDNMAVSGETLDYGPCAFIDEYAAQKVFSAIDRGGRYAFFQQASIAGWNLAQLAYCLAPLIDDESLKVQEFVYEHVDYFKEQYQTKYFLMMANKIGILCPKTSDSSLIQRLLQIMQKEKADYTHTFRSLSHLVASSDSFLLSSNFNDWLANWRFRLQEQGIALKEISDCMLKCNPAYVPRHYKIEEAIKFAVEHNDFSKMQTLLQVLASPYQEVDQRDYLEILQPPMPAQQVYQTFCGT